MTFHVHLASLPDRTNDLVEALAADVGVSNLLVLPGAAREPDGDAAPAGRTRRNWTGERPRTAAPAARRQA